MGRSVTSDQQKKMQKSLIVSFFVLIALAAVGDALRPKAPLTVTYDHRSLLLNGTRKLLISGSIHYPRSSPGMWNNILKVTTHLF